MADTHRFVRLAGKSRRYRDLETGREVSRRRRDALIDASIGRGKREAIGAEKAARATKAYNNLAHFFREEHAKQTGYRMSLREARNSPEMRAAFQSLVHARTKKQKLRALKKLGLRDGLPDYIPPGESGKRRYGYKRYAGSYRKIRMPKATVESIHTNPFFKRRAPAQKVKRGPKRKGNER